MGVSIINGTKLFQTHDVISFVQPLETIDVKATYKAPAVAEIQGRTGYHAWENPKLRFVTQGTSVCKHARTYFDSFLFRVLPTPRFFLRSATLLKLPRALHPFHSVSCVPSMPFLHVFVFLAGGSCHEIDVDDPLLVVDFEFLAGGTWIRNLL